MNVGAQTLSWGAGERRGSGRAAALDRAAPDRHLTHRLTPIVMTGTPSAPATALGPSSIARNMVLQTGGGSQRGERHGGGARRSGRGNTECRARVGATLSALSARAFQVACTHLEVVAAIMSLDAMFKTKQVTREPLTPAAGTAVKRGEVRRRKLHAERTLPVRPRCRLPSVPLRFKPRGPASSPTTGQTHLARRSSRPARSHTA